MQRLCQDLAVRRSDLAKATKRTSQALHRYFGSDADYVEVKVEDVRRVLQELLVIRLMLSDLIGDVDKGKLWMRIPNQAFGNRSPLDLVREGRAEVVIDELQALVRGDFPR